MGDSITFGQYIDPKFRWTSLLADRLSQVWATVGVCIEVLNRGVSGETSRQGLERFAIAVQEPRPDLLILQYGLNDCNCWQSDGGLPRVSEGGFRANLIEMITRARRFGASEIILATNHRTLRLAPMTSGEVYEEANGRYSGIVRDVARETNVSICDVRRACELLSEDSLARILLPSPDLLHLNPDGNKLYMDAIWPLVDQAVRNVLLSRRALA
jgi:acyl-CoA thioesterase-1